MPTPTCTARGGQTTAGAAQSDPRDTPTKRGSHGPPLLAEVARSQGTGSRTGPAGATDKGTVGPWSRPPTGEATPRFSWPLPPGDGHQPGRDGRRLTPLPRRRPSDPVPPFLENSDGGKWNHPIHAVFGVSPS